jgi:hypothetical protein
MTLRRAGGLRRCHRWPRPSSKERGADERPAGLPPAQNGRSYAAKAAWLGAINRTPDRVARLFSRQRGA